MPHKVKTDRDPYEMPYEGWPNCWHTYGTRPDDDRPVLIRVGTYKHDDDLEIDSVAISTIHDGPILLGVESAESLIEALKRAIDWRRIDERDNEQARLAAGQELLDAAVLTHEQWQAVTAALGDSEPDEDHAALLDTLKSCAPTSWTTKQR